MTTRATDARRTPTEDEIPSLLEALAASGATVAAFAWERGLKPWRLYEARRVAAGQPARVPRKPRRRRVEPEDGEGPEFVPVRVVEERSLASAHLELVLGSGHRILVPSGFDEATLRRLVGVLRSC